MINRKLTVLAVALAASVPAWATSGHDTPKENNGQPGSSTSSAGGGGGGGGGAGFGVGLGQAEAAAKAAADAVAAQQQAQQQQQAAQAAALAAGGTGVGGAASGGAAAGGSASGGTGGQGNGVVSVAGGTNQYNTSTRITTLVLPPLPMGPALPPMTTSSSTYERTMCMPNKIVWREPVLILVRNSFGPDTVQQIGWDESLRDAKQDFTVKRVPVAYDEKGQIVYRDVPYGTQALIKTDLMNAASGTTFAFGGLGKSAGAQVGGSDQGAVQRYVTAVQVFECPLDIKPATITTTEIVEVPAKRIRE